MKRSAKTVLHDAGQIIQVPGFMGLPALAVCAFFGEWRLMPGFALMLVLSVGAGQALSRALAPAEDALPGSSTATVALAWAVVPFLAAIPLYAAALTGAPLTEATARFGSFTNALFEATSGFTATGLTMVLNESELPRALQWWRSSIEWVGGIGVVLLALLVLDPSEGEEDLFTTEDNIGTLASRTQNTVRKLWMIFVGYTVAAILAFWTAGMPFWEALNHGMTGIATGGFSVTDDSFIGYSPALKLVGVGVTLVGAVSFSTHYLMLVQRRWKAVLQHVQVITLGVLLILGTAVLALINRIEEGQVMFVDTLFQWVSGWGTCGFSSVQLSNWSPAALLLIALGMFVGGASGSTTGGIKLKRLALLCKSALWTIRSKMSRQGNTYRFDGEDLSAERAFSKVQTAATLALLFLLALAAGTLLLLLMVGDAYTLTQIFFDAASALGTVGLTSGMTGPSLYAPAKYVLMALMYLGRLEITAFLVLLAWPLAGAARSQP